MAGLCAPLPTLRRRPRGRLRTARGRCGSLLLHRSGLAPPTPCRSPGALTFVRCCGSPRASSPHRLATMQLPPARGCYQLAPRRTFTSNPMPMPGTPSRPLRGASGRSRWEAGPQLGSYHFCPTRSQPIETPRFGRRNLEGYVRSPARRFVGHRRRPHISRIERRRGPVSRYGESAERLLIVDPRGAVCESGGSDRRTV